MSAAQSVGSATAVYDTYKNALQIIRQGANEAGEGEVDTYDLMQHGGARKAAYVFLKVIDRETPKMREMRFEAAVFRYKYVMQMYNYDDNVLLYKWLQYGGALVHSFDEFNAMAVSLNKAGYKIRQLDNAKYADCTQAVHKHIANAIANPPKGDQASAEAFQKNADNCNQRIAAAAAQFDAWVTRNNHPAHRVYEWVRFEGGVFVRSYAELIELAGRLVKIGQKLPVLAASSFDNQFKAFVEASLSEAQK